MKDVYETRKNSTYSISKRFDKVSYSKPKSLTVDQFNYYNNNGFLIIKNFFNKDLITKTKDECYNLFENNNGCYVNKEPNSNKVRSILNVHENLNISPVLDSELINIVESLLGDDVYMHQIRINYKDGSESNGWNWHSDFETWHSKDGMPRMRAITDMIPVDDNTIDNGCLNFLPKSHNKFISCPKVGGVNPENEFSEQVEGVPDYESIMAIKEKFNVEIFNAECVAGDLILFDCNTLHYSDSNKTNNKRTNLYFVLNSITNKLVKPFNEDNHRPLEMGYYTNN